MMAIPAIGTRVEILVQGPAGETKHIGVILPGAAENHLTIKLANGYNVSHPLGMIKEINEIEIIAENNTSMPSINQSTKLPKVTIIHTGGTIASKVDYSTGAVVARFEPDEILASVPELLEIAYIDSIKIGNMWSDDIRPQHWNMMIDSAQKAFDSGSVGVVITHGTDTLHVSAAALSFAFAGNGGRPGGRIVLTGSQRSSDRASSDASENLISAVYWAANGPEVNGNGDSAVTIMHAGSGDGICAVSPGVGVRKMHSTRRDAFKTVNNEYLGQIIISKDEIKHSTSIEGSDRTIMRPTLFDPKIKIAQFIAGPHLHSDLIDLAISSGYSAIIIHGTGLGHLPIENSMGDADENDMLKNSIGKSKIPIVVANQCIHGPVDLNVYSKGRNQQNIGVLGHGSTSSPEALLTKVHWLLSVDSDLSRLAENLCGENDVSLLS